MCVPCGRKKGKLKNEKNIENNWESSEVGTYFALRQSLLAPNKQRMHQHSETKEAAIMHSEYFYGTILR